VNRNFIWISVVSDLVCCIMKALILLAVREISLTHGNFMFASWNLKGVTSPIARFLCKTSAEQAFCVIFVRLRVQKSGLSIINAAFACFATCSSSLTPHCQFLYTDIPSDVLMASEYSNSLDVDACDNSIGVTISKLVHCQQSSRYRKTVAFIFIFTFSRFFAHSLVSFG
jgi:hypothetical protein